jgi:fatty acid desaturase
MHRPKLENGENRKRASKDNYEKVSQRRTIATLISLAVLLGAARIGFVLIDRRSRLCGVLIIGIALVIFIGMDILVYLTSFGWSLSWWL